MRSQLPDAVHANDHLHACKTQARRHTEACAPRSNRTNFHTYGVATSAGPPAAGRMELEAEGPQETNAATSAGPPAAGRVDLETEGPQETNVVQVPGC